MRDNIWKSRNVGGKSKNKRNVRVQIDACEQRLCMWEHLKELCPARALICLFENSERCAVSKFLYPDIFMHTFNCRYFGSRDEILNPLFNVALKCFGVIYFFFFSCRWWPFFVWHYESARWVHLMSWERRKCLTNKINSHFIPRWKRNGMVAHKSVPLKRPDAFRHTHTYCYA